MNNLGEKIYELRTKNNMSQGDLAEMLQVSRQSVSKWENNTSVPDLDKLVKMSEIFGISLDELVLRKKEDSTYEESKTDSIGCYNNNEWAKGVLDRGLGLLKRHGWISAFYLSYIGVPFFLIGVLLKRQMYRGLSFVCAANNWGNLNLHTLKRLLQEEQYKRIILSGSNIFATIALIIGIVLIIAGILLALKLRKKAKI